MIDLPEQPNHRILIIDDNLEIHADFKKVLTREQSDDSSLDDLEDSLFDDEDDDADEGNDESPASGAPETIFHEISFELGFANQGEQAIEMAAAARAAGRPYAMAFCDVRMPPGLDGIVTTEKMWEVDPELLVVLCTAYSDYSWHDIAQKLPYRDQLLILKKPFDNVEVRQLAYSLTEKWLLHRTARARMDDLKEMVDARTAELSKANDQLRAEMRARERVEVELRHAQKLESVGKLAAGIAHEINTPLQFINDSVYFLRDSYLDLGNLVSTYRKHAQELTELQQRALRDAEEEADFDYSMAEAPKSFDRVLEGIDRVKGIVQAIKDFGARSTGEQRSLEDINLAVNRTLVVIGHEYKQVATIESDLGDIPQIHCSIGDINQMLLAILLNASQAISSSARREPGTLGRIKVCTRREADTVCIYIQDTGDGIPPDVRPHIFDAFYTTKPVGTGPGLGLTLSHAIIVKKHGGRLQIESTPNDGTTVSIYLPIGP